MNNFGVGPSGTKTFTLRTGSFVKNFNCQVNNYSCALI